MNKLLTLIPAALIVAVAAWAASYVPNAAGTDATLTISSGVIQGNTITLDDATTHVWWSIADAGAWVTFDGSDPAVDTGHFIADGSSGVWSRYMFNNARFIREDATDAAFRISEVQEVK